MSKIQDFIGKRNLFSGSLPINPKASFATWPHLEAPPKNIEKINKYQLSNIELVLTHTILELGVLGIARKLSVPSITLCKNQIKSNQIKSKIKNQKSKKKSKKFRSYCLGAAQNPIDHNMIDRNFKG